MRSTPYVAQSYAVVVVIVAQSSPTYIINTGTQIAMDPFEYHSSPSNVIFGSGTIARLPGLFQKKGLRRPIILSTPFQVQQAEAITEIFGGNVAGIFSDATMHTPVEVTERAISAASDMKADSVVSIGGGSTIGLGKAVSFRTGLYHVTIPTTYAGSEVTPILGETMAGVKQTRTHPRILPGMVIYDVNLTMTLTVNMSFASGINAIAHAVEALYSQNSNPIINMFAQKGVQSLAEALPQLAEDAQNESARCQALYGAWLCGVCLGNGGMSLHHNLCHTLGGSFNLPHAETHTVMLPHVLAYNAPKIPKALTLLAAVLPDSDGDAVEGFNKLLRRLGVERRLEALGLLEDDIDKAADIAVSKQYWNPREIQREDVRELIRRAWAGEEARSDL
ncbi:Maleylacetate reductase [Paramyrothecium foliicola]|nr:Maleylacetate reductase [Paramyrothecium foliicola]